MGRFLPTRLRRAAGLLLALGALTLALAACSDTSLVGSRVDNVTAYYNTFYNANKAFDKGVESLQREDEPVDRATYLSLFLPPGQGANQDFEEAIEKSADVLREHPNSRWVDDALLLIGKAYYFQANDVGAAQKFREVITLGTDLEGPARFWLARTLVQADRQADAAEALQEGLGTEDRAFGTWTDRMYLVRGQLRVQQGRWTEAAAALETGLSGDLPGDLAARGWFLLGQVHETTQAYPTAVAAYRRVARYSPRYELGYAARVAAIRLQGLHGDPDGALDRLRALERDDKNFEKRSELAVLRARLLQADGRRTEARTALRDLLYEDAESAPSGAVRGRAHYALAILYRDAYADYTRAAAHFDTAATALDRPAPRDGGAAQQTPVAILDSRTQADRFGTLADRSTEVARLDSLLRLGRMPREEFRAFVADLQEKRQAEAEAARAAQAQRASARQFQTRGAGFEDRSTSRTPTGTAASAESGFLFYQDPARVQEGRRRFREVWGRRPRVDNWRRAADIRSGARAEADTPEGAEGESETEEGDAAQGAPAGAGSLGAAAGIDVSAVPRSAEAQSEMQRDRATARYELANALFLAAQRPDSAAVWYRRILREDSTQTVARRALYALAEVRYAQGLTQSARTLYEQVLDRYPGSVFAERARERLNLPALQTTTDERVIADSLYATAYDTWQGGRLDDAFAGMGSVVRKHPSTPAAPKALLAAGLIYLDQIQRDSSDVDTAPVDTLLADLNAAGPPDGGPVSEATGQLEGEAEADAKDREADAAPDVRESETQRRTQRAQGEPEATPEPEEERDGLRDDPREAARNRVPQEANAPEGDAQTPDASERTLSEPEEEVGDETGKAVDGGESAAGGDPDGNKEEAEAPGPVADDAPPLARLSALLEFVTAWYPDAPQAERAATLQSAVADRLAPPSDTTVADSMAADSVAVDSVAAESVAVDSTAADSTAADSTGANRARVDSVAGGSERVGPTGDPAAADTVRADTAQTVFQPTPRRTVPQRSIPTRGAPSRGTPADSTAPDSTAPDSTAPDSTAPDSTAGNGKTAGREE